MFMLLSALLAIAGGATDPALSEINRMLAKAGMVDSASEPEAPVVIVSATQEYGNPTPDACCHTFTPLKIGNRTFPKGIGAHSNGRIVVKLNPTRSAAPYARSETAWTARCSAAP
jgi:hypothetical protein